MDDVRRPDATAVRSVRRRGSRRGLAYAAVGATAALGALAPAASAAVNTLDFAAPVAGTQADSGFTTSLPGSTTVPGNVAVAGGLSITSSGGDAFLGLNNQENALALPVDPGAQGYEARTTIQLPNPAQVPFQSAGVFIGRDQDNYVKLVLSVRPQGGTTVTALNFLHEKDGTSAAVSNRTFNPGGGTTVTLILTVDAAGTVTPAYQVDGGPRTAIGAGATCLFGSAGCVNETSSVPEFKTAGTVAGVLTTNYDDDPDVAPVPGPFTTVFKQFVLDNPNQTGATPSTPVGPGGPGGGPGGPGGVGPKILAVAPGPNGQVARKGRIVIEFDRAVRVPTNAVRLVRGNGLVLPTRVVYVPRLNQVVVTPSKPLPLRGGVSLAISGSGNPSAVTAAAGGSPLATNTLYKLKVVRTGALSLRGFDVRGKRLDLVLTSNAARRSLSVRQGA
ncbi:MAG: hypothetical protein AB7O53_17345, partial [Thermoleophilia bacterium]